MGVRSVQLYREVQKWERIDVWIFAALHVVNLALLYLSAAAAGDDAGTVNDGVLFWGFKLPLLHVALLPVLAVLQLLTWLGTHWSVQFNALITMRAVASDRALLVHPMRHTVHAMVVPSKPTEAVGLCKLASVRLRREAGGEHEMVPMFEFHKRRYLWDGDENRWKKVLFPVCESMSFYASSRGLRDDDAIADAVTKWGDNSFEIPLPTDKELFAKQCREPFFVFQVLCVVLWSLDEYWLFSFFTLFMLLCFEYTVVWHRKRNLRMLRDMVGAPVIVRVFRSGAWTALHSHHLVPGDLISLNRNRQVRVRLRARAEVRVRVTVAETVTVTVTVRARVRVRVRNRRTRRTRTRKRKRKKRKRVRVRVRATSQITGGPAGPGPDNPKP